MTEGERTGPPEERNLVFSDGSSGGLLVTRVGANLYRLEESSLFHEAVYHDIIEAERQDDGSLRVVGVVKHSALVTASWIVPRGFIEDPSVAGLLSKVVGIGGNWELTFGGFLAVFLPQDEAP